MRIRRAAQAMALATGLAAAMPAASGAAVPYNGCKWPKRTLTYGVSSNVPANVKWYIGEAANAWTNATVINFNVGDWATANVRVQVDDIQSARWGVTSPTAGAVTRTTCPGGKTSVAEVVFDREWLARNPIQDDLRLGSVHEFGHSLGLAHNNLASGNCFSSARPVSVMSEAPARAIPI